MLFVVGCRCCVVVVHRRAVRSSLPFVVDNLIAAGGGDGGDGGLRNRPC